MSAAATRLTLPGRHRALVSWPSSRPSETRLSRGCSAVTAATQAKADAPPAEEIGPVDFDSIVEDYPMTRPRRTASSATSRRALTYSELPAQDLLPRCRRPASDPSRGAKPRGGARARAFSPFEQSLIAGWGQDPMVGLTVLLRVGYPGMVGSMLDSGGSGDRLRTVYARDGNVVHQHHSEAPLVDMGLGPLEWIALGAAALAIGRPAIRYAAGRISRRGCGRRDRGEDLPQRTRHGVRSDPGRAHHRQIARLGEPREFPGASHRLDARDDAARRRGRHLPASEAAIAAARRRLPLALSRRTGVSSVPPAHADLTPGHGRSPSGCGEPGDQLRATIAGAQLPDGGAYVQLR